MGLIKNLVKKVVGGGAPAKPSSSATPTPPASPRAASPKPAPPRGGTNAESDTPWYLDGQNDGWEDTNVDPAKKA